MNPTLLDTDILSEVLKKKDPRVLNTSALYLAEHRRLAFSAITYYEIVRGLQAIKAKRGLANFFVKLGGFDVVEISIPVLHRAADLWAEARSGGHPRDDADLIADLIIAATALETGRELSTGNTGHFRWIQGLALTDWRTTG
jgi:tRNA(fMet)-specific endonuclease VapC